MERTSCFNCGISSHRERRCMVTQIGPEIIQRLHQWLPQRQLSDEDFICNQCMDTVQRSLDKAESSQQQLGHHHVCVWCGRSTLRIRSNSLQLNTPERLYIAERISPRELPAAPRVCYACWVAAKRNIKRQTAIDAASPLRVIVAEKCSTSFVEIVVPQMEVVVPQVSEKPEIQQHQIQASSSSIQMKKDTDNLVKHNLVGERLKLKKDIVPHTLACQNRLLGKPERPVIAKPKLAKLKTKLLKVTEDLTENVASTSNDIEQLYIVRQDQIKNIDINPLEDTAEDTTIEEAAEDSNEGLDEALEPEPEVEIFVRCSRCDEPITGFVFVCVQCNVRECGACDAQGRHALHYVLRAPPGRATSEVELVVGKVREELLTAGCGLPAPQADEDTKENVVMELVPKIKTELDIEDPLGTAGYGDATTGSQIVPELTVKSEPPDTSPTRQEEPASLTSSSSRRQLPSAIDSDDSQPQTKRRHVGSRNSSQDAVTFQNHGPVRTICVLPLKTPERQSSSNSNTDPGVAVDEYMFLDPGIPGPSSGVPPPELPRTQIKKEQS